MFNNIETYVALLEDLGTRLKEARLGRNESQELFASRLGLTRQSYSKMEKGLPSVPIGYWIVASHVLGRLQTWQNVLSKPEDLFEQFEKKSTKKRQRAGGKRRK